MSLTATFDPILSRVRLAGTSLTDGDFATFERSKNNIKWTTVRGGAMVDFSPPDEASLDDYEFIPGALNYYRVTAGSVVFTTSITPVQDEVWFKSISRPYLNRPVSVVSHGDITRPARNNVLNIIGRTYPVAVTDARLSRRWDMVVKAETVGDANTLEMLFASGDVLYIQVSANDTDDIPGGYVVVGDVVRKRYGHEAPRRWFELPMTEVAPPGPDVVGTTFPWAAVPVEFATWTDVIANFATWADLLDYVADPESVIVP